jgi:hypothetical protein
MSDGLTPLAGSVPGWLAMALSWSITSTWAWWGGRLAQQESTAR